MKSQWHRSLSRSAWVASLALVALQAHAALVVRDSFDASPVGSDLVGQGGGVGFSTPWQAGGFNASSGTNFDIAGDPLATLTATHVATGATSVITGATRSLSSPLLGNGAVYYMSMLVRPDGTLGAGAFSGFFGLTLGNNLASFANEVFVGKPGGGAGLGQYVLEDRGGAGQVSSGHNALAGEVALLVLKMAFSASDSTFSLYVDPLPGGIEPASADAVKLNPTLGSVSYIGLYSTGAFSLDEIRIGTTYADVVPGVGQVPEPSTLALLAMAGAVLIGSRRLAGDRPAARGWPRTG